MLEGVAATLGRGPLATFFRVSLPIARPAILSPTEGATVVSAKNAAKERVSVYIQPPEMNPRVTGGPGYDDPFWQCLARELASPTPPPPAEPAAP